MADAASGPSVTVLLDQDDDVATTSALLDAHDPAVGYVVVHPTPAVSSASGLARDVLAALGRPVARLSRERISTAAPVFKAATAWMIADEIRDLVVLRAHLLSADGWERLIELARCADARLVLVCHGADRREDLDQVLAEVDHHVTKDPGEVLPARAAAPAAPAGPAAAVPAVDLPAVPTSDVHRFRADAWRRLSAAGFARVDAVYDMGVQAACRWMSQHPSRPPLPEFMPHPGVRSVFPPFLPPEEVTAGLRMLSSRFTDEVLRSLAAGLLCVGREWTDRAAGLHRFTDVDGLQLFLTELVVDSPSRRHTITRLRGAQAGFLLHGLHLALPADLHSASGPGLNTVPVTAAIAARLRRAAAHPIHAAAVAAAMFTALSPETLATIRINLLAEDATILRTKPDGLGALLTPATTYAVPAPARPLLLAARSFLYLGGIRASQHLLTAGIGQDNAVLFATAANSGVSLPTRTARAGGPWHAAAIAWWVGSPLHATDGEAP